MKNDDTLSSDLGEHDHQLSTVSFLVGGGFLVMVLFIAASFYLAGIS